MQKAFIWHILVKMQKSKKNEIKLKNINTGLRKIGVFLGDYAEVGCGAVICPGTIIGNRAVIYPLTTVKGIIKEGEIYKSQGKRERKE